MVHRKTNEKPMPDQNSSRTLMALLDPAPDETSVSTPLQALDPIAGLPTLDQRIEMYVRAVYGADCPVTAAMRAEAREMLLGAMAQDLVEASMEAAPVLRSPTVPRVQAASAALTAGWRPAASERLSQMRAGLAAGLQDLAASAGALFTVRTMRMAAVPLVAVLVVGSALTRDWLDNGGDRPLSVSDSGPHAGTPRQDAVKTRSLGTSPAARAGMLELDEAEAKFGATHPVVAQKLVNLASVYRLEGHYRDAEALCTRALSILETSSDKENPDLVRALNELAMAYRGEGRYKDAEDLLTRGKK
jgi:hypothetical protein